MIVITVYVVSWKRTLQMQPKHIEEMSAAVKPVKHATFLQHAALLRAVLAIAFLSVCESAVFTAGQHNVSTLRLKNVKLSVTLSNLNRFSNLLHCWKACEIYYKNLRHYPPHLRHVATLPWENKNSNFLQIFRHMEENANKLYFKYTDFIPLRL